MSQTAFSGRGHVLQEQSSQEACLECDVCNESYTTEGRHVPKILFCGHTVCQTCCGHLIEYGSLRCPFDRHITNVSGVRQLKTNFALKELIGKINSKDTEGGRLQLEVESFKQNIAETAKTLRQRDDQLKEANARILEKSWENNKLSSELQHSQDRLAELEAQLDENKTSLEIEKMYRKKTEITYKAKVKEMEDSAKRLQYDLTALQQHYMNILNFSYYKGVKSTWSEVQFESEAKFDKQIYRLSRRTAAQRLGLDEEEPNTLQSLVIQFRGLQIRKSKLQPPFIQIGHGCYGDVYISRCNGTVVTVKEMRDGMVSRRKASLIVKELKTLCHLSHPNLVQYYSFYFEHERVGLITEYMSMCLHEAMSMNDIVSLSEENRMDIMREMCLGVQFLHTSNIAHCNLKPTNVFLLLSPSKIDVKLTDYGLSLLGYSPEDGGELTRHVYVSSFSSPEVLRGDLLNVSQMMKADIYSLALIFYSVTFGKEPYSGLDIGRIKYLVLQKANSLKIPQDSRIEPVLLEILKNALCYFPEKRPGISELVRDLAAVTTLFI